MKTTIAASVLVLTSVHVAFAQTAAVPKAAIFVNGAYQMTANDFVDDATFRENAEDGRFSTEYELKGGPAFDVAGRATVWRLLGAGAGVTRFSRSTPSALAGSVPHPFFFNRLRSVTGQVSGLKREELAIHVHASVIASIGERLQVTAFGGPSFFQVSQGVVTSFTWSESYPYDEATFRAAQVTNAKASKMGFNGGADLAFFFTRQVGVGATMQFSRASMELPVRRRRRTEGEGWWRAVRRRITPAVLRSSRFKFDGSSIHQVRRRSWQVKRASASGNAAKREAYGAVVSTPEPWSRGRQPH